VPEKYHKGEKKMRSKHLKAFVGIGLFLFVLTSAAWPQNPMLLKTGKKGAGAKNA
jgi:hypothetical protein